MILVGWGTKHKALGLTAPKTCSRCGRRDHWAVLETKKQAKLYFVPVAQWKKRIIIQCLICPNYEEVSQQKSVQLIDEGERSYGLGLIRVAAAVLKVIANIEGRNSPEWERAQRLLIELSEGAMTVSQAQELLIEVGIEDIGQIDLDEEQAHVLLVLAIQVAISDGHINERETKTLNLVAERLGLHHEIVALLISYVMGEDNENKEKDFQRACETLGVTADTPIPEIRNRYKRLMKEHHPDRASSDRREEATRRSAEINHAYDLLIGRSQASSAFSSSSGTQHQRESRKQSTTTKPKPNLCQKCTQEVDPNAKFCGSCGIRQV